MSITRDLRSAAQDLRASAEKALNVDAIKTAVEPYVAQAKDYTHLVTDKAEAVYAGVRSDKRVAKLVGTAEQVTGTVVGSVVGTVQERVVKPVLTFTGRTGTPAAKPAAKPAAAKPATTTPATTATSATTPVAPAPAATKPAATPSASAGKPAAKKQATSQARTSSAKTAPNS
jgi:hypothetical protein